MRKLHFVFGVAAICVLPALLLLIFNLWRHDSDSRATQGLAPLLPAPTPRTGSTRKAPGVVPWLPGSLSAVVSAARPDQIIGDAALEGFARWTERYFQAPTAVEKAELLAEGKSLALARREAMIALIETDPKRALELAAPWKWHEELPAEIAAVLERAGPLQCFWRDSVGGSAGVCGPDPALFHARLRVLPCLCLWAAPGADFGAGPDPSRHRHQRRACGP